MSLQKRTLEGSLQVDPHKDKGSPPDWPVEPIQRFVNPLVRFLHVETASGFILLLATAIALVLANSPAEQSYRAFWDTPMTLEIGTYWLSHSLHQGINDGFMLFFSFVIGLEV